MAHTPEEETRIREIVRQELHRDDEALISTLLKKIPLFTRFKVFLEMQHLNLMIQPDRCCTDEESAAAHEWALSTTQYLMQQFIRWERDGRPEPTKADAPADAKDD